MILVIIEEMSFEQTGTVTIIIAIASKRQIGRKNKKHVSKG